jgi:hypothetical protein
MAQTWIGAAARLELAPLQKREDVLSAAFVDGHRREEAAETLPRLTNPSR